LCFTFRLPRSAFPKHCRKKAQETRKWIEDREQSQSLDTRKPPVDVAETLEIFEFMTAAQLRAPKNT